MYTGDHGEMLWEHGEPAHTYFIYQSAIKVPLIFKLPGQNKSKKIETIVGLVDIVPTVCKLLDVEIPEQVHGKDMAGRVLEEIIDPDFLTAHPIEYIDSYENHINRQSIDTSDKTGEAEQYDYLRSLGYVK